MALPTINPEFKNYVCIETDSNPWAEAFDINGNGSIGVDDMKTLLYQPGGSQDIDKDRASLDRNCRLVKMGMIRKEIKWKYQALIAGQTVSSAQSQVESIAEVSRVEKEMLAKLENLASPDLRDSKIAMTSRSIVVETSLRARALLNGQGSDEPFGIGVSLVANPNPSYWWPIKITDVHPASAAAAAGILPGDLIVAINGKLIPEWSTNGTFNGLEDPEKQMPRGLSGPKDSELVVAIKRGESGFSISLHRNIWSGRHLGVPRRAPVWDGTVSAMPLSPVK